MMDAAIPTFPKPWALWGLSACGLAWNAYGVVQLMGSASATPESLMAAGLTADQAAVMTGYPTWMTVAFAIGVFGGLAGSVLLAMRDARALPVLLVSLAAYVALWIGDAVHGVFAAMGSAQVVILTAVVAIAAGLYGAARVFARKGALA